MPRLLLIFSQPDYLIQIVAINLHTSWQTVQIQISWLLKKPTDLDLHCLQNRVYPGSAGQGLNEHDFVNHTSNNALKDLKEVTLKDFQFEINNKILVRKSW